MKTKKDDEPISAMREAVKDKLFLVDLAETMEDFNDGLIAKKRANEPRESLETVKKLLTESIG